MGGEGGVKWRDSGNIDERGMGGTGEVVVWDGERGQVRGRSNLY